MSLASAELIRGRLQNIAFADGAVRDCARRHLIGEYLAGQVTYNLGEYPKRFSIAPTDYDRRLLSEFASHGVRLIQIHEEWNDPQRRLGADKFTSHDPVGFRAFVDVVHELGMKIIPYVSTGFFEATDPDFDPCWAEPSARLVEVYYNYAKCSPASPEWRAYLLPRLQNIMDEYGVDGLYDDLGFHAPCREAVRNPAHVWPGPETPEYSASLQDLLSLVMDMVHARGGVLKVHGGGPTSPPCRQKVYDYLWVGEGVRDMERFREQTRGLEPYVVPGYDMSRAQIEAEDDMYLHSVPFMQFPLRVDGRPFTGERAVVEGVNYRRGEECFWTRHSRTEWRRLQETPDSPPMYGWWDSSPGRPEGRARWLHHFDLYRPMVDPGTHAWIDVGGSDLFAGAKPPDVTASLFANSETYLVLGNYGRVGAKVALTGEWQNRETAETGRAFTLQGRDLLFLKRIGGDVSSELEE